jgi:hypothetical protein
MPGQMVAYGNYKPPGMVAYRNELLFPRALQWWLHIMRNKSFLSPA